MLIPLTCRCNGATKRWYDYEDWWNYCSNGEEKIQATIDDIGKEVPITINNQVHMVRLIDVDRDEIDNDSEIAVAHTTFEFSTVISDDKGWSLALQWNDINHEENANNYLDSTIRKALNGTGKANHFLWAEEGAETWSETYNKTVLDMLPSELVAVLKDTQKYVLIKNESLGVWRHSLVSDKLFLLSPREMGYEHEYQETSSYTSTYSYYKDHSSEIDAIRMKNQSDGTKTKSLLDATKISGDAGQYYQYDVINGAGCNEHDGVVGASYWLRSPFKDTTSVAAWAVTFNGQITEARSVYNQALGIAPAFCI